MKHRSSSGFRFFWPAALLGMLLRPAAEAQELPAAPLFDGGEGQCGKGAVLYQPSSASFTLSYDAGVPADGFRQYRFHIDGGERGAFDALDKLPVKGITAKTVEVGPGKPVDLSVSKLVYGRLRAYDAQGRESEPAPVALVPLATPGLPVVGGGQTPTLSWQGIILPTGLNPAPTLSYQVFRFPCTAIAPCATETGLLLGEQGTTTLNLGSSTQYRYAVRAVARFSDGSPAVFSQPSFSAPCNCNPTPVTLTVNGLGSAATPSAKFTLPAPIISSANITPSGTLCWSAGACNPGDFAVVGPAGVPRADACQGNPECDLDPEQGMNHAAFFYRIGSGGPAQTGSTIGLQPAGTEIFLFVNDGGTDNNSGGFTVNLNYNSEPQCSSR